MSEQTDPIIAYYPPPDVNHYTGHCARCGSSVGWIDCHSCDSGYDGHDCGEDVCCCMYPTENVLCNYCNGQGGWWLCLSSPDWCEANPLAGREAVERGNVEWKKTPDEDDED